MITNILAAALMMFAVNDTIVTLDSVMVVGQQRSSYQMRSSYSSIPVSHDFLQQNFSASLMQSLEGIPGVKAMSIGSGQSKPTIRGLGFNRMVVVEDGVKHEGQQWGDDHGLEIDQFSIERADIIKGPATLLYGSEAIGGVLNLYSNKVPTKPIEGNVDIFGRTNNDQLGISAKIASRQGKLFFRANFSLIDYADYKVPTDSIQYYSYWIKLKNNRLRNTAGRERDGSVTIGYSNYNLLSYIRVSDYYSKSGFFANAHGLEVRLSDIDYDRSPRDIDLPYQWVNHLKILSHTTWNDGKTFFDARLAFQNNLREEHSEPVSHGYMPKPPNTLERRFSKNTFTANLSVRRFFGKHELNVGVNAEYQHNRRSGWGFIIPDFETLSTGLFVMDRYTINDNLIVNAGVRYDHSDVNIKGYNDWYATPINGIDVYKHRSSHQKRHFQNITGSVGVNYSIAKWIFKANVGKSFRVPIPKELGADGVNYHIFRYEKGNENLDPEESYQADISVGWSSDKLDFQVDPYFNYFPNYIYLNPTSQYVEGLQLYNYSQARVIRYGVEAQIAYRFASNWQVEAMVEYLHARQRSGEKKGYTLPFAIPFTADAAIKYTYQWHGKGYFKLNIHFVDSQTEIVPPEKPTSGYVTVNLSAGKTFPVRNNSLNISMHIDNMFNRKYYDHTSFYRLIEVPEPGRNISLRVGYEF